jgi:hypothetical protein
MAAMRYATPLLLCALLLSPACSETDPKVLTDTGTAALGSGDSAAATKSFEAALAHMDSKHPDFLRASMGRCQSLARKHPMEAKQSFLDLARQHPSLVKEADYVTIIRELVRSNAASEAVEIVDAGIKAYSESTSMLAIRDEVGDAVKASHDPAALEKLKGLGYTGADDQ